MALGFVLRGSELAPPQKIAPKLHTAEPKLLVAERNLPTVALKLYRDTPQLPTDEP
jgi:hypothetical protein